MLESDEADLGSLVRSFVNPTKKREWICYPCSLFDVDSSVNWLHLTEFCEKEKDYEMDLHNYFRELQMALGSWKNNSISLYDLPSMVKSSFDSKDWNQKKFGNRQIPFLFSQCREGTIKTFEDCVEESENGICTKNMSLDKTQPCCNFWTNFLEHDLRPIMTTMRKC